jgi:O-antigen ligase
MTTLAIGLSLFAAATLVESGSLSSPPLLALLALAGATIFLSIPPTVLFVGWLSLAPFLQNSASDNAVGNALQLALYLGPPLVFLLWTLTASNRSHSPSFIDLVPFAYLLVLLGSIVMTSEVTQSTIKSFYLTTAIGVIVYYFVVFGPLRSNVRERVVAVVLTLATIEALMSVVDGLTKWNLWDDSDERGPEGRAVATLASPGALGTFIGIGVVLAIAVLVWQGPKQLRRLAVLTIATGFPGMFFTLTRGPIVATVVVGLLLLLMRPGSRLLAFASLLLATAILGSTWSRLSDSTVYRERVDNQNTVEIRVELQRLSLQLAKERPIFGWGPGSFDRIKGLGSVGSGSVSRDEVLLSTSHNTFLTVLVEQGVVGLGLLLMPWLVIGWRSLGDIFRHPRARWFLVGSLAVVAVYAISASTYDTRYFSLVPALTLLFLGLLRRHQLSVGE